MTVFDRLRRDPQGLGMTSQRARDRLLERLKQEGIRDPRVLDVIRTVPRHLFVDESLSTRAYEDSALPIGLGQTISQPYVVARMTEALIEHGIPNKVLEIGTGSGYQAAVLAPLVPQVFTVERILKHLTQARRRLREVGAANVRSRHDDGRRGWPEEAPFDGIVVTAAAESVDQTLIDQLAPGGVLIAPLGPSGAQELIRIRKLESGVTRERLGGVSFVPLLPGLA
jgi:protein-L-isoaspartate(D-aspartate) O-methyltransferase